MCPPPHYTDVSNALQGAHWFCTGLYCIGRFLCIARDDCMRCGTVAICIKAFQANLCQVIFFPCYVWWWRWSQVLSNLNITSILIYPLLLLLLLLWFWILAPPTPVAEYRACLISSTSPSTSQVPAGRDCRKMHFLSLKAGAEREDRFEGKAGKKCAQLKRRRLKHI